MDFKFKSGVSRALILTVVLFCSFMFGANGKTQAAALDTWAEKTQYQETGRYTEVIELCREFSRKYPNQVVCQEWGKTLEGRPLLALIAGREAHLPKNRRKLPVVYAQGGIHAAEIDGKDAGFLFLRDLLMGRRQTKLLDQLTFVFVPVLNVDGHERFGPDHRPNQNGPKASGWRVNSQNLNLNRDYLKLDSAELRQLAVFWRKWDPILSLDLHVTDGADFQNQLGLVIVPSEPLAQKERKRLATVGQSLRARALSSLKAKGIPTVDFYPSFKKEEDPKSGFAYEIPGPRFSHGYWSLQNRIGVLVETHSWKDYKTRVIATVESLDFFLNAAASEGSQWMREARLQEQELVRELWPKRVALKFKSGPHQKRIDFPGYAYTQTPSEISGGVWIRYDSTKPEIWNVPLFDEVLPDFEVNLPQREGGYWVEAGFAHEVMPLLKAHGISFSRVTGASGSDCGVSLSVDGFRVKSVDWGKKSYEGRLGVKLVGSYSKRAHLVQQGDLFIPWAQPRLGLVLALFEPETSESLASWGFFNSRLERREYMEDYVAEGVARQMLASDASLKTEFEKKLLNDAGFKASVSERLDFFYRRHPSWDERFELLPVSRLKEGVVEPFKFKPCTLKTSDAGVSVF